MPQRISDILPPKKTRYPEREKISGVYIERDKKRGFKKEPRSEVNSHTFVFPKKILIIIFLVAFPKETKF